MSQLSRLSQMIVPARLWAQFVKEVLSILRDPRSRMVVFVPPMLQLMVFAFAATLEVRNVDIAVHNQDAGYWSQEFMHRLEQASFVTDIHHVDSSQELSTMIERGTVIAAVAIPADFSRRIGAGDAGELQLLIDGRRSNSGQIVSGYVAAIVADIDGMARGAQGPVSPVMVRNWFNPNLIYRWFIVPGLTGVLALFSALLITSLSIARERELGTFDQLLVSPASTIEIIISKSLPALFVATFLGTVMIGVAVVVFGIPLSGSFLRLLLGLVLFNLSVVGIGLMISAASKTQQQAILGAFSIGVPAVLLSGFATPVENMPLVLQWLAQAIPLTHFLVIIEGSFLKAMPFAVMVRSLWPLLLIATLSLSMAFFFVRRRLQ